MAAVDQLFVGIDISKAHFDVVILDDEKSRHRKFSNNVKGFAQLHAWFHNRGVMQAHVCMEATGRYGEELALDLHDHGHVVSVVNPARIKGYAKSQLSRTKTDAADAEIIARFCKAQTPESWVPAAPEVRELQALTRRLANLHEVRQQEVNRSQMPGIVEAVAESIRAHVDHLDAQIKELQQQIADHIDRHPDLRQKAELLTTIPGVGDKTAATLLSELPDVEQFKSAKQVAAHAGLVPAHRQSGSSVHGRSHLSKIGNALLRSSLYFPAIVAMHHNPVMVAFARRLLAAGKAKKLIVAAIMRKLLHMVYGILKTKRPFDAAHQPANA